MAVAAAIGVGSESTAAPSAIVSSSSSSSAPRISHKMRMQNPQLQQQQQDLIQNHQPVMGEINKSIEKMSLGTTTTLTQQQQFRR